MGRPGLPKGSLSVRPSGLGLGEGRERGPDTNRLIWAFRPFEMTYSLRGVVTNQNDFRL